MSRRVVIIMADLRGDLPLQRNWTDSFCKMQPPLHRMRLTRLQQQPEISPNMKMRSCLRCLEHAFPGIWQSKFVTKDLTVD